MLNGRGAANSETLDAESRWPLCLLRKGLTLDKLVAYAAVPGEEWHVVGSAGLSVRDSSDPASPPGRRRLHFGTIVRVAHKAEGATAVQISSPEQGFVSIQEEGGTGIGLVPGGATVAARWRYKVVCRLGALVREGPSLASSAVEELPYLSIIEVSERLINEQGIARLRTASGWISEALNPLSGQRGAIVELIPLIAPLRFVVVQGDGVVVTRGVELASTFIRRLEAGALVDVCSRKFSEFPAEHCVPRLKLCDGSGWALEPEARAELSKIKGSALRDADDNCVVCLVQARMATLVHGAVGHIACCTECARILKARGDVCPVCREPIDLVIQHFWA
ncbi:hypothetical protein JKP88DRAFT_205186 [Tribonema minus]|uniref:RING-type domain-containing protein n=1 Tax=Tribonema minus TaxID=303371 RepID=A0A836CML9_9STRA|nr:hypothetical protein JKP88DRAFT_205186 [Tribonema minus]